MNRKSVAKKAILNSLHLLMKWGAGEIRKKPSKVLHHEKIVHSTRYRVKSVKIIEQQPRMRALSAIAWGCGIGFTTHRNRLKFRRFASRAIRREAVAEPRIPLIIGKGPTRPICR